MDHHQLVSAERLRHLESLAGIVHQFIAQACSIDAAFDPWYAEMAHELRALGYAVRDDITTTP